MNLRIDQFIMNVSVSKLCRNAKGSVLVKFMPHDNFQRTDIFKQYHCRPWSVCLQLMISSYQISTKVFQLIVNLYITGGTGKARQMKILLHECFLEMCDPTLLDVGGMKLRYSYKLN